MDEQKNRSAWGEVSRADRKLLDVWQDIYAIDLRLRDVIERNPHIADIRDLVRLRDALQDAMDMAIPSDEDMEALERHLAEAGAA